MIPWCFPLWFGGAISLAVKSDEGIQLDLQMEMYTWGKWFWKCTLSNTHPMAALGRRYCYSRTGGHPPISHTFLGLPSPWVERLPICLIVWRDIARVVWTRGQSERALGPFLPGFSVVSVLLQGPGAVSRVGHPLSLAATHLFQEAAQVSGAKAGPRQSSIFCPLCNFLDVTSGDGKIQALGVSLLFQLFQRESVPCDAFDFCPLCLSPLGIPPWRRIAKRAGSGHPWVPDNARGFKRFWSKLL